MRVKPKSLIWDTGEIIPALSVLSDPVLLGQSQAGQTVLSTLPVPPYMVIRSNLALLCDAELKSPTTDPSELILILFTEKAFANTFSYSVNQYLSWHLYKVNDPFFLISC